MTTRYLKADVDYTDHHGKSEEYCSRCRYYDGPRTCQIVAGAIKPGGWCRLFKSAELWDQ